MLARLADRLEEGAIALLLAVMTLVTFWQVVARYVFNASATWALEFTTFCFAWLIFLGMSYGVKKGAHIGVDAAVKLLPVKGQRVAGLVALAFCLAYTAIVLIGSWAYVAKIYAVGIEAQDLPVPLWIPIAILPFGFALLGVRFVQVFWKIWSGRQTHLGLGDEAADLVKHFEDDGKAP